MSETGRQAGRKRDAETKAVPLPSDDIVSVPWQPRTDGKRAILVNERSTVFDRPAMIEPAEVDAVVDLTALGPMPTEWTPDLVHCRLVYAYGLASELPQRLRPAGFRCTLGQLQPQMPSERRRPLGEPQLAIVDWTWTLVWRLEEDDRSIVRGFMSGASLRDIAAELAALQARGIGHRKGIGKDTVAKRYRAMTKAWAEAWNRARHPIDRGTCEVWATAAGKNG